MIMESNRTDAEEYELQFRWKMSFSTICKVCDIIDTVIETIETLKELVDRVIDTLKHLTERLIEAFNNVLPTVKKIKEVYSCPQSYTHTVCNHSTNTKGYPYPIPCRARSRC